MINQFQSGLEPVGHFDFLDSELSSMKGGEVVVLDTIPTGITDASTPDVWDDPPIRVAARKATNTDRGPFYLADSNRSTIGESEVGFETTTLYTTATSFIRTDNVSGKLSLWAQEGFYSITSNVVENDISTSTPIYTELYSSENGFLTTVISDTAHIVGYFIEYRRKEVATQQLGRFHYAGTSKDYDTVIIYKSNADGYNTADVIQSIVSTQGIVGLPTDGTYADGFFDTFTQNTRIADAIDDISEAFLQLAPAKAGLLTGTELTISGTTLFSARLPSGLVAAWYTGGESPGDTITTLIIDNTYILTTADLSTRFRAGKSSDLTTAGVLTYSVNATTLDTYDIGALGTGTVGQVTVLTLDPYNTFWLKANANASRTQIAEGLEVHVLSHTEAGAANSRSFHYDDVNTSPSFSTALSVAENSPVDGYLSGIINYAVGSTFTADFTLASGIFQKAYHPTAVAQISGPAMVTSSLNPGSIPAVADAFIVSNAPITLSVANVVRETHTVTATGQKPDGTSQTSTAALTRPVNTYGTNSTTVAENFVDEAQRLVLGTTTAWTSSNTLVNGNAQVYISGSSGAASFARPADYSGFSGDQEYQRFFSKVSASNGSLVFSGIVGADVDAYLAGSTNILLELETGLPRFYDLGRAVGDNLGDGSGNSRVNSRGGRVSIVGSTLNFSFGVNNTGGTNNNRYRMILIFKNTNDTVNSIVSS